MHQATGFKHVVIRRSGATIVAFGIVVCCLTAVATLSLTGDLPARGRADVAHVSTSAVTAAASHAERRQLSVERGDFLEWRANQALDAPLTSRDTAAAERQLQMERGDFLTWRQR